MFLGLNLARIFQSTLYIVQWRYGPFYTPPRSLVSRIRISFIILWWQCEMLYTIESNTKLIKLQREAAALTRKYELLQQEATESMEGQRKLEQGRDIWTFVKSRLMSELEVLGEARNSWKNCTTQTRRNVMN
jgi:hypothetical protein